MNIKRLEENGITILVLSGRLDATQTASVDQAFAGAFGEGARRFVWDFQNLTYISSDGLRSVLQALKRLGAHDGRLAICAPSPLVLEVFEISGFKSLLTIATDRPAAVRALS